jgi:acetolactate synthase small subunit
MQLFHIRYRNAQGALMRILNAVSRRGIELNSVHAEAAEHEYAVTLLLEANHKQSGQLFREWYSIVDVIHVNSSPDWHELEAPAWASRPPRSDNTGARAASGSALA